MKIQYHLRFSIIFNIFHKTSEFNEDLPENYQKILHLYDIWHWIKVKFFLFVVPLNINIYLCLGSYQGVI